MPLNALSLKDLMDWIDSQTQTIQIEHSDRNAANAVKVRSDFVYIPRFKTAGFPAAMVAKGFRNDVELGGFALAKYPSSHPLATMTSKGGNDGANWGSTYAAMSLPLKCCWTYIDWNESILACEAMNQKTANGLTVDDIATGTATGGSETTLIDTAGIKTKMVGDNLEIVHGGVTYYRRIINANPYTNTLTFTPKLPTGINVTNLDNYIIKKFTLWGPYEWATVKYLCAMRYTINKMPYPKGNSNYGKDDADADAFINFGRPDPDYTDASYTGGRAKVLTGTGHNSWYHNGKPDGIWGLKGNVWQWCKFKVGAQADRTIDAGFPGQGHVFPVADGYQVGLAISGDCGISDLALVSATGSSDPDFNRNYYYQNTGALAAHVSGAWYSGSYAGVFDLGVNSAPSFRGGSVGFRAVA
jgi:hypothetical protein